MSPNDSLSIHVKPSNSFLSRSCRIIRVASFPTPLVFNPSHNFFVVLKLTNW
ncbi:hypothetical protein Hanom_Chr16g01491521 [Helianthus anomalus]